MKQDKNKEISKIYLNMYTNCLKIKYTIRSQMDCNYYLDKFIHHSNEYNKDSKN